MDFTFTPSFFLLPHFCFVIRLRLRMDEEIKINRKYQIEIQKNKRYKLRNVSWTLFKIYALI